MKGVTEAITLNKDIVLKTQCGKELEKQIEIPIFGLENFNPEERFSFDFIFKNKTQKGLNNWLKAREIKGTLSVPEDVLKYLI